MNSKVSYQPSSFSDLDGQEELTLRRIAQLCVWTKDTGGYARWARKDTGSNEGNPTSAFFRPIQSLLDKDLIEVVDSQTDLEFLWLAPTAKGWMIARLTDNFEGPLP